MELSKFKLSLLNTFSASIGYILANFSIPLLDYSLFFTGTLLMSMSSQVFGQAKEVKTDALMVRCSNRPIVMNRIPLNLAVCFGGGL
mmetsp:Transcript_1680/g.3343  ORF Transcript_1680/g.3343 Transcript_1680/m.3343 type:complete len:87 (-) Transcript_1680:932-1192(-)